MCLLSPPENVIWGEFEDCFSAWSLPWSSDNTSPNAQITSTARVQWFLHIWTHHPFQFCAIQMPAAMHCGHCFNTSTAWLCLSHQAEKRWKLEKCPLFVKQCSSAKKKKSCLMSPVYTEYTDLHILCIWTRNMPRQSYWVMRIGNALEHRRLDDSWVCQIHSSLYSC